MTTDCKITVIKYSEPEDESKKQTLTSSNPSAFRFDDKTGLDFDKIEVGWGGMKLDDIKIAKKKSKEEVKQTDDSNDIVQQIKDLNEMYKSGALTKEEFEKAKKKLLN